jgi:hypothetical protein
MTKNLTIRKSHILPWEDVDDFEALVGDLYDEYEPQGPAERHLVEEIAGIIWRERRVGVAEVALHQYGLNIACGEASDTGARAVTHMGATEPKIEVVEALGLSDDERAGRITDGEQDLAMTEKAHELASAGEYEAALQALREDTLEWWRDTLEAEETGQEASWAPTAASLADWLHQEALPVISDMIAGVHQAPAIRTQAYGESLNPDKLNELAKWQAHLDRRFEGALSLLMKLQNTRRVGKKV